MRALVKHLMLPAVLVAGLAPVAPTVVSAETLELELGGRNPQLRLIDPEEEEFRRERRSEQRRMMRREDDFRCSAGQALDKAARLGVRRPYVTAQGRRFIEVSGRRYGARVEITFARDRRCSIID